MRRLATLTLATALALFIGGVGSALHPAAPVAQAAQTWSVVAGGEPAPGMTAINFYPQSLTIDAGDTVSFSFPAQEPHTVTFDAGQVPGLFLSGVIPNSPGPGDIEITKAFSPLNADGAALSYDGTKALSSGIPMDAPEDRTPFSVVFPKAGVYHFECAVHGPLMAGTLTVVASGQPVPETPDQVKARGTAEAAGDLVNTNAFGEAFPIMPGSTSLPGGATLHTLLAGLPGDHMTIATFMPANFSVKRGDLVTWSQPDPNQFHTVTFLSGSPEPSFFKIVPQPGGPPKILLPAFTIVPSGGDRYTGSGVVTSGTLTPGASWTMRVDAPPGSYEYVCLYHADDYNMKGTITVTP